MCVYISLSLYIYIYIYIHIHIHTCTSIYIYIYIYIYMHAEFPCFRGNNLSRTTCLTQAFFKRGEDCSTLWCSLTQQTHAQMRP